MKSMRLCKSEIQISGKALLSGVCGKHNSGLNELVRQVHQQGKSSSCVIEKTDSGLQILATSEHLEFAKDLVMKAVQKEKRRLLHECMESTAACESPGILLTAGGSVSLILMPGEFVTVEVFHPDASNVVDSELLALFEGIGEGIASYHNMKHARHWGYITYRSFLSAQMAIQLLNGKIFQKRPLQVTSSIQQKAEFTGVRVPIIWLRGCSRGFAFIQCSEDDVERIIERFHGVNMGSRYLTCKRDRPRRNGVFMYGLGPLVTVRCLEFLLSNFKIDRIHIPCVLPPNDPPTTSQQKSLSDAMGKYLPLDKFKIDIQEPQSYDYYYRAYLEFDKSVVNGYARAVVYAMSSISETPLPGYKRWQPVISMPYQSVIQCSGIVQKVLRDEFRPRQILERYPLLTLSQVCDSSGQRIELSCPFLDLLLRYKAAIEKLIEGTLVKDDRLGPTDLTLIFTTEGSQIVKSVEGQSGTVFYCDKRNYSVKVYGSEQRKKVGVRQLVSAVLNLRDKEIRTEIKEIRTETALPGDTDTTGQCPICLDPFQDEYKLEGCGHGFCRKCLVDQINSAISYREGIPITCAVEKCGQRFLIVDIKSLLTLAQQQALCIAAVGMFVTASRGSHKFCYTPDCPSVYRTSNSGELFVCSICSVEICRSCHVEYHEGLSCEVYKQYRNDPDASLDAWKNGKEYVKKCPSCASIIEKTEGCNHIICRCGKHICWNCLELFDDSGKCYSHLSEFHGGHGLVI